MYAAPDKFMLLFSVHDTKTQNNKSAAETDTEKTTFKQHANNNTQSERQQRKTPQLILPTHKNTPCTHCMQGVVINLTAEIGFSDLVRLSKLRTGSA